MTATLASLYNEYVIGSLDRQMRLADVHGEDDWGFSMTNGELTFGETVAYQIQILGTESHVEETWLWGWANEASGIPPQLLTAVESLRSYGEQQDIKELTTPFVPMEQLDGHTVGLIASGFAGAQAYYRCPYENGALFVLITDPRLDLAVENPLVRAPRMITECISMLEITDHRQAIAAYLRQMGLDVAEHEDGEVIGMREGQQALSASFDELNRLAELKTHLTPENR